MADRDQLRAAAAAQRAAQARQALLEQPTDPGERTYIGVVTGLAAGARVQGPITVATIPATGIDGPAYPGAAVRLRTDFPALREPVELLSGFASNGDVLLAVKIDGRWVARRWGTTSTNPCPDGQNTICVHVYSPKLWCDWWHAHQLDPSTPYPDINLPGASVTIEKSPLLSNPAGSPAGWVPVSSGTTDADGRYCVTVTPVLADPTAAPTVEPIAGGVSGGPLQVGTWVIAYQLNNGFGSTLLSPPSASFQVGIPDPQANPALPAPTVNPTGGGGAGGPLAAGRWAVAYQAIDGAGGHARLAPSAGFVLAGGEVPRVALPSLATARPNAAGLDLFVAPVDADDAPTDAWRRNNTATITTTSYDITNPYSATQPAGFSFNNSRKGIPRITIPGGVPAGLTADLYVGLPPGVPAGPNYHLAVKATASPWVLTTYASGPPPDSTNGTGNGYYRATITIADCPTRYEGVSVQGRCQTFTMALGFCCWQDCIDAVTDADGGALAGVQWVHWPGANLGWPDAIPTPVDCYNPDAFQDAPGCTPILDSCTTGEPSATNAPGWLNQSVVPIGCTIMTPQRPIWHPFVLKKDGYFDRCMTIPAECDVPSIRNAATTTMYRKDKYVGYYCCGNCNALITLPPGDLRPAYLIKRRLLATFNGPAELLGAWAGVPIPLLFDATTYDGADGGTFHSGCMGGFLPGPGCKSVWDSGCLGQSLARGACYKLGTCHAGECGTGNDFVFGASYFAGDKMYNSARARLTLLLGAFGDTDQPSGCWPAYVEFLNYWGGGCPEPDPPPVCDPDWLGDPFYRVAQQPICCPQDCNCAGTFPAGKTWLAQLLGTQSWAASTGWSIMDGRNGYVTKSGSICAPTNLSLSNYLRPGGGCSPYAPPPIASVTITEEP